MSAARKLIESPVMGLKNINENEYKAYDFWHSEVVKSELEHHSCGHGEVEKVKTYFFTEDNSKISCYGGVFTVIENKVSE